MSKLACCNISTLYLVSVAEQAGLRHTRSETPKSGYSTTGHIFILSFLSKIVSKACHEKPCGPVVVELLFIAVLIVGVLSLVLVLLCSIT